MLIELRRELRPCMIWYRENEVARNLPAARDDLCGVRASSVYDLEAVFIDDGIGGGLFRGLGSRTRLAF